jgi:hypothetical protein
LLVLLGLLLTVITSPAVFKQLRLGPSKPQLYLPTWQGLKNGVLKAGLAQLPLTSLNSVIAVSHLAAQLFPEREHAQGWRWRPGVVAVSVGAMNLVGCWFGAFPCCHGSGGLAAQVRWCCCRGSGGGGGDGLPFQGRGGSVETFAAHGNVLCCFQSTVECCAGACFCSSAYSAVLPSRQSRLPVLPPSSALLILGAQWPILKQPTQHVLR